MAIFLNSASQWYRAFEKALRTSRPHLRAIAPEGMDVMHMAREITNMVEAERRDVYRQGQRVFLSEDKLPPTDVSTFPPLGWEQSPKGYAASDYRQSDAIDIEEVYLDTIAAQRSMRTPFLTPKTLKLGDRVVVWLKDHFYENQTAVVISIRHQTNEYLVEVLTKKPNKRGYRTNPDAKALMYVKLQDVKLCRRRS